jgi:hypothetical protein
LWQLEDKLKAPDVDKLYINIVQGYSQQLALATTKPDVRGRLQSTYMFDQARRSNASIPLAGKTVIGSELGIRLSRVIMMICLVLLL